MAKATRLVRMAVKNIAAVDRAANKRTWLMVKAASPVKSGNELRRMVEQAVRDRWGSVNDWSKAYLHDIYGGSAAIFCRDGEMYSADFEITDGRVEFEEPKAVTIAWVEKRDREQSALLRLAPTAMADLPNASFALVKSDAHGEHTRQLLFKDAHGDIDIPALRHAIAGVAALDATAAEKASVRQLLKAAAEEAGLDSLAHAAAPGGGDLDGAIAALTAALTNDSLEKAGRKISAARMSKLKDALKTLTDIIEEQETEMAEKTGPDANALQKFGATLTAAFARLTGADAATVASLEKAASGEQEQPIPAAMQELMAKASTAIDGLTTQNAELKTQNEALAKRVEASEGQVKELTDAASLRKFAEEVTEFAGIGLDPAKDAALLKSVEEKCGKESADRLREVFKSQLALRAASGLMGEVGSAGAGQTVAKSAQAELDEKVASIMTKAENKLTREQAINEVYGATPGLYDRIREETLVRI